MTTTTKIRPERSKYPFGGLPVPKLTEGSNRDVLGSFVIPDMSLADANTLCANAQRYYPGRVFVCRKEGEGVRIWRTT